MTSPAATQAKLNLTLNMKNKGHYLHLIDLQGNNELFK